MALGMASAGLLFGYDIGVTGGVTSMPAFLRKFFPDVAASVAAAHTAAAKSAYCTFDSPILQLFTSSLFLSALVSALAACEFSRAFGRRASLLLAGAAFLVGTALTAGAGAVAGGAHGIVSLVVGRIALGVGVGFANQSAPLMLNECAPYQARGGFNILFQLMITIGISVAQLVNMGTLSHAAGWRVSLAAAGVPAVVLTLAACVLPDSPNSLAARGYRDDARRVLVRLRGTDKVDAEFEDIVDAVDAARAAKGGVRTLFSRRGLPLLSVSVLVPLFQQMTGINSVMFYSPILLSSLGFGANAALLNTVIVGAVNVLATVVSIVAVDRFGRKPLFMQGGVQMVAAHATLAGLLAAYFKDGGPPMPKPVGIAVIAVICLFVSAFAWSWGPLGWLVPAELQPLHTRSAAQGINVAVNMLLTTVIAQTLLSMMCAFKPYVFLFFAAWVAVGTVYVWLLVPEGRGVPQEEIMDLWESHPVWGPYLRRCAPVAGDEGSSDGDASA